MVQCFRVCVLQRSNTRVCKLELRVDRRQRNGLKIECKIASASFTRSNRFLKSECTSSTGKTSNLCCCRQWLPQTTECIYLMCEMQCDEQCIAQHEDIHTARTRNNCSCICNSIRNHKTNCRQRCRHARTHPSMTTKQRVLLIAVCRLYRAKWSAETHIK